MNTEIYYFSGTGNSMVVAKDIAKKTRGKLISIPAVVNEKSIKTDADKIGIVFPAYMAQFFGIPLIVEKFIKKLENIGSKYIFAVCTCGGHEIVNALPTLKKLAKVFKSYGGKLSAEYSVRLPMNNSDYDHIPIPIEKNQGIIIEKSKNKIEAICQRIIETVPKV
jgi:flavodoxin